MSHANFSPSGFRNRLLLSQPALLYSWVVISRVDSVHDSSIGVFGGLKWDILHPAIRVIEALLAQVTLMVAETWIVPLVFNFLNLKEEDKTLFRKCHNRKRPKFIDQTRATCHDLCRIWRMP